MRILVIGASRGIGLETVQTALAEGHRVRAFARSAGRIGLSHRSLEKLPGDALDPDAVDRALDGVDAVVQAMGVPLRDLARPVTLFSAATRTLLPAMERRGVRRLLCVTGFGAGDSRRAVGCLQRVPFRLLLGRAYDDKDEQERLVRASALDWTIVRPGILVPGPGLGRYRVLAAPSQWRNGFIARADVADFIVRQLDGTEYLGQAPVLVCA